MTKLTTIAEQLPISHRSWSADG